jgi:hypothetical protein
LIRFFMAVSCKFEVGVSLQEMNFTRTSFSKARLIRRFQDDQRRSKLFATQSDAADLYTGPAPSMAFGTGYRRRAQGGRSQLLRTYGDRVVLLGCTPA